MRALIVYESMYGNTHTVADRIADGLRPALDVTIVSVHDVTRALVADADLLVVGGPTHVHAMATTSSRESARAAAAKPGSDLVFEDDTEGPCLRGWFETVEVAPGTLAAAFDTRISGPTVLTGRASKGIADRLRKHGCELSGPGESFLVDLHNQLLDGEADRAQAWGLSLAAGVSAGSVPGPRPVG